MAQYDTTNKGTLGRNESKREGKSDPDYSGTLDVAGVKYYLSGWRKKGNGAKGPYDFISLACKPAGVAPRSAPPRDDFGDEPPF
jgi:hypothetical protein